MITNFFQRMTQAALAATATWLIGRSMAMLTAAIEEQAKAQGGQPGVEGGNRQPWNDAFARAAQPSSGAKLVACPVCDVHVPEGAARDCGAPGCPYRAH